MLYRQRVQCPRLLGFNVSYTVKPHDYFDKSGKVQYQNRIVGGYDAPAYSAFTWVIQRNLTCTPESTRIHDYQITCINSKHIVKLTVSSAGTMPPLTRLSRELYSETSRRLLSRMQYEVLHLILSPPWNPIYFSLHGGRRISPSLRKGNHYIGAD